MSRKEESRELGQKLWPDVILSIQVGPRNRQASGEWRLALAVLERAIADFRKCFDESKPGKQNLFREVEGWIFDEEDPAYPFSFGKVCEVLDIDPDGIRAVLRKWMAENHK